MRLRAKVLVLELLVLAIALSAAAFAQPIGPDSITRGDSQTAQAQSAIQQEAQAGNVTSLSITASRATQRWQGFFGNVTGTISLEDAAGNSLYQWADMSPQGEIYAVNSSTAPTWNNVGCFNFTKTAAEQNVTLGQLEASLGEDANDVDGVNETFNLTFTGSFDVGSATIDENSGCKAVSLNVNDAADQLRYNETILTDNSTKIIYAALLEQDATGFQGHSADFQMVVGEDGDTAVPTSYWFYVELT